MKVPKILDDAREIASIWTSDDAGYIVGKSREWQGYGIGCTRIVAYGEPGLHCNLPWFAVYVDEMLVARVPAHRCQVVAYAAVEEG